MFSRPEQILEKYELELKSVSKGRDCFLCDTNLGLKALKEYRGSKERAEFYIGMQEFLYEQGILVERVIRTMEQEPFVIDEDESKWILSDTFHGAECDTKSKDDISIAAEQLAGLHNTFDKYQEEIPEFLRNGHGSLIQIYEKHNRELRQVRNYIRTRKKKNEFEELFTKQYDMYWENALQVTELLKQLGQEGEDGICHGNFNQHNVIFSRQGIAIMGLESFSYGNRMGDLANFLRKMMEKNNWNIDLGRMILESYQKLRPLDSLDRRYIYVYLAYPEKFWKIANHYNNSHKAWLSARNTEKLEKIMEQENYRKLFLQKLFYFSRESCIL